MSDSGYQGQHNKQADDGSPNPRRCESCVHSFGSLADVEIVLIDILVVLSSTSCTSPGSALSPITMDQARRRAALDGRQLAPQDILDPDV